MAVDEPVFFDTSVLLGGLIELAEVNQPAQRILKSIAEGKLPQAHTAWHCCLEFFSVPTRLPSGLRLRPADATLLLEKEIFGRFEIHDLPPEDRLSFFCASTEVGVAGGRVYDAHIAEVARSVGVQTIVTENRRHFMASLRHGIAVVTAAEFVETAGIPPDRP